jgi:hypothetical protein
MQTIKMLETTIFLGVVLEASAVWAAEGPQYPALAKFTQAMKDGQRVKIAYFGGSITTR